MLIIEILVKLAPRTIILLPSLTKLSMIVPVVKSFHSWMASLDTIKTFSWKTNIKLLSSIYGGLFHIASYLLDLKMSVLHSSGPCPMLSPTSNILCNPIQMTYPKNPENDKIILNIFDKFSYDYDIITSI